MPELTTAQESKDRTEQSQHPGLFMTAHLKEGELYQHENW